MVKKINSCTYKKESIETQLPIVSDPLVTDSIIFLNGLSRGTIKLQTTSCSMELDSLYLRYQDRINARKRPKLKKCSEELDLMLDRGLDLIIEEYMQESQEEFLPSEKSIITVPVQQENLTTADFDFIVEDTGYFEGR